MKKYLLLTFGILFVYKLILALQGFDLTDEGFVLTFYQQIFHAPETVEYQFLYYLSSLVGGVWNILFGFGGIFSFRVLAIIVDLLIIYVTCLTVKKYIHHQPHLLLIAAFFVVLFHFGVTVFHHNQLTALLDAGTGEGTHNVFNLVKVYISNYKNIYIYLSIFVFTTFFFLFIYNRIEYFEKFIRYNHYKVAWENNLFAIYTVE